MDEQWHSGVWLGVMRQTEEVLVGTNEGTVKARSVRRKPWSSRWNLEDINNIKGAPWGPVPGDEEEEVPIVIRLGDETIIPQRQRKQEGEEHRTNRMYIKREDIAEYGATAGCPGCRAIRLGQTAQRHTEECMRRLTEEIAKTTQGKRRQEQAEERAGKEEVVKKRK